MFTQQTFIQDKSPSLLPYCFPKYVDPFMGYSLVRAKGPVKLTEAMSHAMQGHPRQTRHREEFGQNVVCWRRGWQTTAVFLLQEPHDYEQYGKAKRHNTRR